jgi:two-component system, OmpR family, sensor histidine kinase VanS
MIRRAGLSVRVKLALSYAGFLVVAGVALVVVGLLVLRFVPQGALYNPDGSWAPNRTDLLEVFVRYAWWAIAALVVFGLVGGWLLAGLVLRPLQRITDAAARARDGELDRRVGLPGRRDELTDLADTFDALLDRVQHTIDEERRFAANASHELRTPHAIVRTLVEVAQADAAGRDVDQLLERIGTTNDRAIATTEGLLTLARAGRGEALVLAPVDLAAIVAAAMDEVRTDAAARGIRIESDLSPATVSGDAVLLTRLAANLLGNALVHNIDDGWIGVRVAGEELVVANGGPAIDAAVVGTLAEPFVRGAGRIRSGDGGAGLGLAIVASIVRAHRGELSIDRLAGGGLQVRVRLPR